MSGLTENCIEERIIGTLAIRILEKTGGEILFEKGPPEKLPADLFLPGEERIHAHLESCSGCRTRLLEEIDYFRAYCETVDSVNAASGLEKIWKQFAVAILHYVPPFEDFSDGAVPLAARTEGPQLQPLRFSSDDERVSLIEVIDPINGSSSLHLRSDDLAYSSGASVIIEGQIFKADRHGRINLGGNLPTFDKSIRIAVIPTRRGSD